MMTTPPARSGLPSRLSAGLFLLNSLAAAGVGAGAASIVPEVALAAEPRGDWLDIEVGKSVVIETPKNATAIAITDPTVADIVPLASANKIQVQGKSVGTTDLIIQLGPGSEPTRFDITVHTDLSDLIRRVGEIVEGEPPRVYPLAKHIVVDGPVPDLDTLEEVASMARAFDPEFVNLMTVRGDHQVQLELILAEVSRNATREIGMTWSFSDSGTGLDVGITQPTNPVRAFRVNTAFDDGGGIAIGAELSLMDDYNLAKYLAQPTIVCLSGQQCEFLAGGEVPYVSQAGANGASVSFKEYGVKMSFVPTILAGSVVDMRVQIELSEIDRSVAIGDNFGIITRKTKSHVRVTNGHTMAISGMLLEHTTYARSEVPLLGRIPLVGVLFRYTKHVKDERELVIFVTPRLVRPLGPGEVPAYPGATEDNNPTDLELFLLGLDHRPGSRTAEPTGDVGLQR